MNGNALVAYDLMHSVRKAYVVAVVQGSNQHAVLGERKSIDRLLVFHVSNTIMPDAEMTKYLTSINVEYSNVHFDVAFKDLAKLGLNIINAVSDSDHRKVTIQLYNWIVVLKKIVRLEAINADSKDYNESQYKKFFIKANGLRQEDMIETILYSDLREAIVKAKFDGVAISPVDIDNVRKRFYKGLLLLEEIDQMDDDADTKKKIIGIAGVE
jgi:hypothetical protein